MSPVTVAVVTVRPSKTKVERQNSPLAFDVAVPGYKTTGLSPRTAPVCFPALASVFDELAFRFAQRPGRECRVVEIEA